MAVTRVAVLGAGGFIGNRIVEMFHLAGRKTVLPIVRRPASLALSARFPLRGAIADARDEHALAAAFAGCDAVVAATSGSPAMIVGSTAPLIAASRTAGVRRLVYLSSQMVHGQAPPEGTCEDSAFARRQPLAYNRAKAKAEQRLRTLAGQAGIELVILRPGIVYGPRSRWTGGFAEELLAGRLFLGNDGDGICNAIYVDNLVAAIERAIDTPSAAGEAFFVNDAEVIRWRELIEPLADALGIARAAIPRPRLEQLTAEPSGRARRLLQPIARRAFRRLPRRLAHMLRAARHAASEHRRKSEVVTFSRETALLQSCRVRLSHEKAERLLGYIPPVSFAEAQRRSIAWLKFAGFPVA
jgi:nucleoside-diphosphate-sugar epimerase